MNEPLPDWKLPAGVDRGLWDYLHSAEMVDGYEASMAVSALAAIDVAFCEEQFSTPGRLIDLGCGTGRLALHFARKGFNCLGVDLSEEMLKKAREIAAQSAPTQGTCEYRIGNLTALDGVADGEFDYAACLFSTLGMIRGDEQRRKALAEFHRVLKPGGRLVLHVHNRFFVRELGVRGFISGEITMPQAYGGAPLTLHHYRLGELKRLLTEAGFQIGRIVAVDPAGRLPHSWWLPALRSYGYLVAMEKPNN